MVFGISVSCQLAVLLVIFGPMEEMNTKMYEVDYLVMPLLDEAAAQSLAASLRTGLTALSAEIAEEGAPKMVPLAYDLPRRIGEKKFTFTDAYFGWMRFHVEPSKQEAVKELFTRESQLLRHLIITLDKNALLAEKKQAEARAKRAAEKSLENTEAEAKAPENAEAAIDKEIDSMVAES